MHETAFRAYLQRELIERCRKNGNYSLRSFARALQMDPSTLSQILRGRRTITRKTTVQVAERLGLDPQQLRKFTGESREAKSAQPQPAQSAQELTLDAFHIISDWYHYAIFELVTVTCFKPDSRWIAKKLGLSVSEINIAVERLFRLELLTRDAKGKWVQGSPLITTTGNPMSAVAFRKHQAQILQKAAEALESVPIEERDNSGVTMAIHRRRIPEAKARIKKFRRELCDFLQQDADRDSVYQLAVAFYPFTQKEKGNS